MTLDCLRDYLGSYLCIDNGSRTGAIAHMKLSEIENAVREGSSMVVTVLKNKTLGSGGPAPLSMSTRVSRHLGIYKEKARPQVYSDGIHKDYAFVRFINGKQMKSFNVTDQFNSLFIKAVGKTSTRQRVNATLVRKSCSTKVSRDHPELRGELAVMMGHSQKTQQHSYYLPNKVRVAGNTAGNLRSIMRGQEDLENSSMTEKDVINLFHTDDNDNMELVMNKLVDNGLAGSFDPRKIYEKLCYAQKKKEVEPKLPDNEETTEDH